MTKIVVSLYCSSTDEYLADLPLFIHSSECEEVEYMLNTDVRLRHDQRVVLVDFELKIFELPLFFLILCSPTPHIPAKIVKISIILRLKLNLSYLEPENS